MAGHGGKRPGAGKPKGKVAAKTLEKMAVQAAISQRILQHADSLFNAQFALSVGSIKVFRIDEETDAKGNIKRIHTLVTDADEIKEVLDTNEGGPGIVGEHYYFVSDVLPDNRALDSLFNRGLGKPKESMDITSNGETIKATFNISTRSDS